MKSFVKQFSGEKAFTIVELLTVMSIIVVLFGLLVPALNMVRRYAKDVRQKAQLKAFDGAIQLFYGDFDGYPDSTWHEPNGADTSNGYYPGGMKLAEAMVGQDLLGFHPASNFDKDGTVYPDSIDPDNEADRANLRSRKGPYLPVDKANANALPDIFTDSDAASLGNSTYRGRALVLCDEYTRVRNRSTGKRIGMPVLYYKANPSNIYYEYDKRPTSIYNSDDNQQLVDLELPWASSKYHPMSGSDLSTAGLFYTETTNPKITTIPRPYNPDTYILMSAGYDGLYGTDDDIFNFEKQK